MDPPAVSQVGAPGGIKPNRMRRVLSRRPVRQLKVAFPRAWHLESFFCRPPGQMLRNVLSRRSGGHAGIDFRQGAMHAVPGVRRRKRCAGWSCCAVAAPGGGAS
jgi:hypothetical protein